jgi:hypothetical protein
VFRYVLGSEGCVLVPRSSGTPVATWTWPTWVVSRRRVLDALFILLEFLSPSRRIFIGSHSLPPSLVRRIGPSWRGCCFVCCLSSCCNCCLGIVCLGSSYCCRRSCCWRGCCFVCWLSSSCSCCLGGVFLGSSSSCCRRSCCVVLLIFCCCCC